MLMSTFKMHVCCFGSSPRRGTAINHVWKSLLQRRVFKIYSLKRGKYQCFVPVVCRYWYLRTSRVFDSDLHALIVQRGQTEKHHSTIYCLETPPVFCTRQGVALIQSAYLQGGVWTSLEGTPFSSFLSKCCTARDWFCLCFYSGLFEHEKQIFVLIYSVNVLLTASFSLICFASAVTFSTVMALWLQQYIYSLNESGSTVTVACSQTVHYLINTWATAEFQSNLV